MVGVPVALWVSALLIAYTVTALDFIFNRTIFPINPGLSFSSKYASYVSSADSLSPQDPSNWALEFDLRDAPLNNDSWVMPSQTGGVTYVVNGTGMHMFMTGLVRAGPALPQVSCLTGGGVWSGGDSPPAEVHVTDHGNAAVSAEAGNENAFSQYRVTVEFDAPQRWRINNITNLYSIPLKDNHTLNMTEILANGTEISPPLPVTEKNDTWLSSALVVSREAVLGPTAPYYLDSTTAKLVDLPPNVAFISVLGPRYLTPGYGGECRFVFDPPFIIHGMSRYELYYSYAITGNPTLVNQSYPDRAVNYSTPYRPSESDELPDVIPDVHLLNQQLDPNVRYKFAILKGSSGDGVIDPMGYPNRNRNSSVPSICDITKIQVWQSIPDPSKQKNETSSASTSSSPVASAGAEPTTTVGTEGSSGLKAMSLGAIVGTVIGAVLGGVVLGVLADYFLRRRRRGRRGDLFVIEEEDNDTSHAAPPGPSNDGPLLGILPEDLDQPGVAIPLRGVRREEDAGALPGDHNEPAEDEALPPLYREEWRTGSDGRVAGTGAAGVAGGEIGASASDDMKRRRPGGSGEGSVSHSPAFSPITAEEIKFLGMPVTSGIAGQRTRHQE